MDKDKKLKNCTLYVDGMHCASCEILIEKKLLKENGIEAVDATLKDGVVNIAYVGKTPDVEKLNDTLETYGYSLSEEKIARIDAPLLRINKNGDIAFNTEKLRSAYSTFIIVAIVVIAYLVIENLGLARFSVDANSSLVAFFVLGLVAGVSSCAALVGGLLLSMIKQWNDVYAAETIAQKAQPHILFHIGRIAAFFLFGGLLGLIGDKLSLSSSIVFPIVIIIVSVIMVILALQMLDFEWAYKLKFSAPKFATRFVANENNFQGRFMPAVVGILTFILPCGFTLTAQGAALTTGSFLQGALTMTAFALGTFVPLALISLGGLGMNRKPHLTAQFNKVAGIIIVLFAFFNINAQLNVLGVTSLSDIFQQPSSEASKDIVTLTPDGKQVVGITAKGFNYTATTGTTIKAGVETSLEVDNQGITGCGVFMAARGLFQGYRELKPGKNVVSFTPQKGTYKLTCTMGMVPPITINVI
jgi:sulfite exporter TauE/SafE/copper chaperone CopZ